MEVHRTSWPKNFQHYRNYRWSCCLLQVNFVNATAGLSGFWVATVTIVSQPGFAKEDPGVSIGPFTAAIFIFEDAAISSGYITSPYVASGDMPFTTSTGASSAARVGKDGSNSDALRASFNPGL